MYLTHHSSASRITSQQDSRRVMLLEKEQIGSQTVVNAAWERKLRRKSISGRQHSSFELSSMPLHLIAMLVHAAKVICAAMNIENDALSLSACSFPCVVVLSHLYPFCFKSVVWLTPLPPGLAADLVDAVMTELRMEERGRLVETGDWDAELLDLDPAWCGHPLRGESLEVIYGVI